MDTSQQSQLEMSLVESCSGSSDQLPSGRSWCNDIYIDDFLILFASRHAS